MNNRKGFTLVELLAVIVILALLIVITANTILPMMSKTKKNAMLVYASEVIEKASANYIVDSMTNGSEPIVYSIEDIMGGNTKYYGAVKVSTVNGKYQYDIAMFDDEDEVGLLEINLSSSEIKENIDDIVDNENYYGEITVPERDRNYYNNITNLEDYKFKISNKINLIKVWNVKDEDCAIYISGQYKGQARSAGSTNWRCTEYFIEISPGETYKFNGAINNNTITGVAFYNEANKSSFISGISTMVLNESNGVFTAPNNAHYMRITWVNWGANSDWKNTIYVIKNS